MELFFSSDLKALIFPEVKMEDFLFVNSSGMKLPRLQNYPGKGSILYNFGLVTGLENFCLKMLRKASESVIQSSEDLSSNTKDLNSHSKRVGQESYDRMRGSRRIVYLTNLSKDEGCPTLRMDKPVDETQQKKREERDKKNKDLMIKKAEEYLMKMKNVEPWDLRPGALKEEDVQFLKTIFTPEMLGKYFEKHTLRVKFIVYHFHF